MTFRQLNKKDVVKNAQNFFLKKIPLQEIDNEIISSICKDYRNKNNSLNNCRLLLNPYFNYFYNWAETNWMVDVFYFQR
jgi:hypothetical protein